VFTTLYSALGIGSCIYLHSSSDCAKTPFRRDDVKCFWYPYFSYIFILTTHEIPEVSSRPRFTYVLTAQLAASHYQGYHCKI